MMLTDDELAYIWSVAGEVEGFLEDFPRATGARAVEIVVKDIPRLRAHIAELTAELTRYRRIVETDSKWLQAMIEAVE